MRVRYRMDPSSFPGRVLILLCAADGQVVDQQQETMADWSSNESRADTGSDDIEWRLAECVGYHI